LTQVSAYTGLLTASAAFPTAFPQPQETLFIIWIGGNDFLGDLPDSAAAVTQAVVNIRTGMTQLASAGAVTFMVVNLPDLGQIPRMNQDDVSSTLGSLLAIEFNIALENVLVGFESTYPAIEVVRFNSYGMLNDIIADPEAWRFSNVTDQKLDNGSVAEGRYLFWDDIHPTTITHNILAHRAVALLACDCMGVPRFGADLKLTLPYAELGVDAFGFSLDFCENPAADPDGYYWKLDLESITVE
jgi:phospholipase/lecithinase/hemolysin